MLLILELQAETQAAEDNDMCAMRPIRVNA
jgi:hypothetical protein